MAFRDRVHSGIIGGHETHHRDDETQHYFIVRHNDGDSSVILRHGSQYQAIVHSRGADAATLSEYTPTADGDTRVPAPSERLQQLIAQHHLHPDQWPILLDALQEEYPQLHEAIESHHAARRAAAESDATQYARAFTEIAR